VASESESRPSVLVLVGDAETASDVADSMASAEATAEDPSSQSTDDNTVGVGRADVVVDAEGLNSIRGQSRACRVVALVDDPIAATATDPLVDAIATSCADVDATVRWLAARGDADRSSDKSARTPSRTEQLNAEMRQLTSVRSIEEGHQTAVDVAGEVFPGYHCVVGVRNGEWVEPTAASSEVAVEGGLVRVGRGSGYAIYTDVTEQREAKLREQNERLDKFASIVSHDLRNPLSVAEGYVSLASETGETSHLTAASEALDRIDELVCDLLSPAR
jgi:signal transduction histidine kinase